MLQKLKRTASMQVNPVQIIMTSAEAKKVIVTNNNMRKLTGPNPQRHVLLVVFEIFLFVP